MIDFKHEFDKLSPEVKDFIMEVVAQYHYRNGTKHPDGSRGDINITLKEMNDTLAYVYHYAFNEGINEGMNGDPM